MIRLVLYLVGVAVLASGLAWLADRPGNFRVDWEGYVLETSVFRAVVLFAFLVALAMFLWSIARQIWQSPAAVGNFFNRRRQERGLDALSSGMIAVGAGDRSLATKYAVQARKALPNEPLTHLLRAQAAQLQGDRATSRRIFEAMLGTPDTEQLGLRGLYLEAEKEGEMEAARQFAERALSLNPKLGWPVDALFDLQCKASDWAAALETLATAKKHGHVEKPEADRRRAVLLTAQAQDMEDENGNKALELATEAHNLAADLVPAAAIAGRQLASRGNTGRAAKIIERTWKKAPHPDLATVYAFARPGDSPRDRLDRIKRIAKTTPHSAEGPIAVATAAVEAKSWDEAREALQPLLEGRLSQRVCTLMARIEGEQHNDTGRVREWLARAVNAPRDPAWTADGIVSERWAAISPVTGALDAYQWRVPLEAAAPADGEVAIDKLEEFVMLGTLAPAARAPAAGSGGPRPDAEEIDVDEPAAKPRYSPSSTPAHPRSPAAASERSVAVAIKPVERIVETPAAAPAAPSTSVPASVPRTSTRPVNGGGATAATLATATAAAPANRNYGAPRPPDDPGPDANDDVMIEPIEAKPAAARRTQG
ncbi:MAG: heme biosynthesis protein HemY [Hyphomicrobiaceae bacterium]